MWSSTGLILPKRLNVEASRSCSGKSVVFGSLEDANAERCTDVGNDAAIAPKFFSSFLLCFI